MKTGVVPRHLALLMDGNRRYAKKQDITNIEAYTMGYVSLKREFVDIIYNTYSLLISLISCVLYTTDSIK